MPQRTVLVRWKCKGSVLGERRGPGDEDVMPAGNARFLRASGMVEVVGPSLYAIPKIRLDEEDVGA